MRSRFVREPDTEAGKYYNRVLKRLQSKCEEDERARREAKERMERERKEKERERQERERERQERERERREKERERAAEADNESDDGNYRSSSTYRRVAYVT